MWTALYHVSMSCVSCRSKVEILKEQSDFLRHPLMEELVTEEPNINEGALQLMKFHGSYQQDDRDKRGFGKGKAYQFMMRTRQPAGLVSNQLYLTMDDLADQVSFSCLSHDTPQHAHTRPHRSYASLRPGALRDCPSSETFYWISSKGCL